MVYIGPSVLLGFLPECYHATAGSTTYRFAMMDKMNLEMFFPLPGYGDCIRKFLSYKNIIP
jgi:hypothetical protein